MCLNCIYYNFDFFYKKYIFNKNILKNNRYHISYKHAINVQSMLAFPSDFS